LLGWDISVRRKVSNELVPAQFEDETGQLVAQWTAEIEGLDWIESICSGDGGFALGGNGYPYVFTLSAGHLESLMTGNAPPECKTTWINYEDGLGPDFEFYADIASQVSEDEWLIFTVWDVS
jgi:hypothetical protein